MASSYSNPLRLEEIGVGEASGTWGTKTNTTLSNIATAFAAKVKNLGSDADATLTMPDGSADDLRALHLKITSTTLTATRTITIAPNTVSKIWIVENATTGSQAITFSQGSGANVSLANGETKVIYTDGAGSGAAVVDALTDLNISGTTKVDTLSTTNFTLGGAAVSSTAAELNILDGVTSTASELNILDGVTATTAELNYLDIATLGLTAASKAVTADANGVITLDNGFSEEYAAVTSSSAAVSLDLQTSNNFSHDLTENTTISFTNPAASGKVSGATLRIIQGSTARTITWNSSIKWAGDTAPTLSTGDNDEDIFVFYTVDNGGKYYGFTAGQDMS